MQTVDENERSRRRRAVYSALQPFMSQQHLVAALWLWEEGFAGGSAFQISGYLHALCVTEELRGMQSELRRALIRYMAQSLDELGPDPWPLMRQEASRTSNDDAPDSTSPVNEVLAGTINFLLDALLNINPVYASRVRALTLEKLVRTNLDIGARAEVTDWLSGRQQRIVGTIPLAAMQGLVNLVYVFACEYFGPRDVDRVLADAVRAMETTPAGRQFNPRQLL
jgi:hypothetical protein